MTENEVSVIVFGSDTDTDKVGVAFSDPKKKGVTVAVCEAKKKSDGSLETAFIKEALPTGKPIEGECVRLHFTTESSLKAFMKMLLGAIKMFDE
jgi:hypothetical protein